MKVFQFVPILALVTLLWLPFSQPASATEACPGATLSPNVPHEVTLQTPGDPTQKDFDCFSWQSLVGLSWAAEEGVNGVPDESIPFGQTGDRDLVVWQTYKGWESVFPQNDNPQPCEAGQSTEACWNSPLAEGENLYMTSKSGGFLDGQEQAVPNAWLTDQNGKLTRYEILVNQDEFDFIIDNKLYNGQIQKSYSKNIDMPPGENNGPVGPIELKAAWKIISDQEKDEYFSTLATIQDTKVNPENGYPQPNGGVYMTCTESDNGFCDRFVGLVGFHIAHKVKDFPQWIWSTFEHKNNVPIQKKGTPLDVNETVTYSYFNKDCDNPVACQKNTNPRDIPIPVLTPNQVTRYLDPAYGGDNILPKDVNEQWQGLVAGTVWKNYELISTQWINSDGDPTPQILANTTMETYIQGDHSGPEYASSCIKCHQYGALLNGKKADFSYLFSRAKPN
ncbi:MAG: hypothetical protein F6K47_05620 [Symploca sp. SIO2E6]|nr:hypothetical protein [Symploca sp. SIO2E6]